MRLHPTNPAGDLDYDILPEIAEGPSTIEEVAESTRRMFLGRAMAAAVPAAALASSSAAEAQTSGGNGSSLPTYYRGTTQRTFQQIQNNEFNHLQIVVAAIRSLGGTPRPYPTFRNITTSDAQTLLRMSTVFENTGAGAYLGGGPFISNPAVLSVATSLGLVEAYQGGFLNSLSNLTLIPGGQTTATPLTPAQVFAVQSPFIVSLNDNGQFPPTYSTTPSAANDIAILNFALLQEQLEATFYFNSVPRVFNNSR